MPKHDLPVSEEDSPFLTITQTNQQLKVNSEDFSDLVALLDSYQQRGYKLSTTLAAITHMVTQQLSGHDFLEGNGTAQHLQNWLQMIGQMYNSNLAQQLRDASARS